MINILTMDGFSVSISPESSVTVIKKDSKYPHWGWWVVWALVFWPVVIALVFMGKEFYRVNLDGVDLEFDTINYALLMQVVSSVKS